MNQNDNLQNPMMAALKTYNIVETILKQAKRNSAPIGMAAIISRKDVQDAQLLPQKVRDTVGYLVKKGYVVAQGPKSAMVYHWKDLSNTFTPSQNQLNATAKRPSRVKDVMKENVVVQSSAPAVSKEIELVVGGVTIIISKNQRTGRPRIVIEG